jgi:hypothetical protein
MKADAWTFDRPRFDVDTAGFGTALYSATTPDRTYTLVAFSHELADELRSDRVIATAWDATFALHDGVPSDHDVERLRDNVPRQEAGRVSESELTLSRANRSVRLWSTVVESLAAGRQPQVETVEEVGYLMRTTAVYGSGKFGAADRQSIENRVELEAPFQAEMLTVYLIRAFVMDLAEHVAAARSPHAVLIEPALRRRFGIGNSTGLGMAPFVINHPRLINNWVVAREEALARVRGVERPTVEEVTEFRKVVRRARGSVNSWRSGHELQQQKVACLVDDLEKLDVHLDGAAIAAPHPWDQLVEWSSSHLSVEGQEMLVSLLLEPYGHLVDDLVRQMHADESTPGRIDGSRTVGEVRRRVADAYEWALEIDWSARESDARAWYVSEEKLEPRLGERHVEPVGDYEQPLQPGRDAAAMFTDLCEWDDGEPLAAFLRSHPEHRHTARRLEILADHPYAEIHDNTISATVRPIDLLRAKLSFFGATHFDPRSDRWVRINMFRGAPFPHELRDADADDWAYAEPAAG